MEVTRLDSKRKKKQDSYVCNVCYIWKTRETYDLAQVILNPIKRMHAIAKLLYDDDSSM